MQYVHVHVLEFYWLIVQHVPFVLLYCYCIVKDKYQPYAGRCRVCVFVLLLYYES